MTSRASPGEHEEVLLVGLPVVHPRRLARTEHSQTDPHLREDRVALERQAISPPLGVAPSGLARVKHEPSLPGCHKPGIRLFERCLRDHDRMLAASA